MLCWGSNYNDQLGDGSLEQATPSRPDSPASADGERFTLVGVPPALADPIQAETINIETAQGGESNPALDELPDDVLDTSIDSSQLPEGYQVDVELVEIEEAKSRTLAEMRQELLAAAKRHKNTQQAVKMGLANGATSVGRSDARLLATSEHRDMKYSMVLSQLEALPPGQVNANSLVLRRPRVAGLWHLHDRKGCQMECLRLG